MAKQQPSLTKTQLADEFAERLEQVFYDESAAPDEQLTFSRKEAQAVLDAVCDMLIERAGDERGVSISGKFKVQMRHSAARNGRNPATGETIKIPASIKPKIALLKGMKDAMILAHAPKKKEKTAKSKKDDKKSKNVKKK